MIDDGNKITSHHTIKALQTCEADKSRVELTYQNDEMPKIGSTRVIFGFFYVSVADFLLIFAANLNKTAIKARNLLEGKENYSNENKNH